MNTGYGFIQADAAIATFAAPKPEIGELILSLGSIPGKSTIRITVKGNNFIAETSITMNKEVLKTTFVSATEVIATIPVFSGDPAIQAYNPPISSSKLDGGYSNSFYFSRPYKDTLTFVAENAAKKYGEPVPSFTYTITMAGLSPSRGRWPHRPQLRSRTSPRRWTPAGHRSRR